MKEHPIHSVSSLEFLLQHSPAVTYVCRPEGDFGATFVTENVYDQLGYRASDFINNPRFWSDHIHPEDREQVYADIHHLFDCGTHVHEYRFLAADGNYRWMRDELRLVRNESGQPSKIVGYWIDITDRVEAEQALRQRELTLTAALNDSTDAIVTTNEQGVIQWLNPAAEKLFAYVAAEVVGRDIKILVPEKLRKKHSSFIERYRETKHRYNTGIGPQETVGWRKDGTAVSIEISLSETTGWQKTTYIAIIRDITKRKQQEKDRLKLQRQLQNVQRMESIGHLAGGVAHEFNNILAIVLGHADLGLARLASNGNGKLTEYFEQIRSAANRGRDVVMQLLAYTKGTTSKKNQHLNLYEIMNDLSAMLRALLPTTIEFSVKVDPDVPLIVGNKADIQQLLLDLCSNARDAMAEQGTLNIDIRPVNMENRECSSCGLSVEGEFVEVTVTDTGHGLEAEDIPRIFEPFYSTKAPGKGTGLGMSVLHGIVHGGGGHIIIESEKNKGTTVRLLFPQLA